MGPSWWRRLRGAEAADRSVVGPFYLAYRSQKLLDADGAAAARARLDDLLATQGLPPAQRDAWCAFLLESAPIQPGPFVLEGFLADEASWLSVRACGHIARGNWRRLAHELAAKGWSPAAVELVVDRFRAAPALEAYDPAHLP